MSYDQTCFTFEEYIVQIVTFEERIRSRANAAQIDPRYYGHLQQEDSL